MKRTLLFLAGFFLLGFSIYAQKGREKAIKEKLENYFINYTTSYTTFKDKCRIEKIQIDAPKRILHIYTNEQFAAQSFDKDKVRLIYDTIGKLLPSSYSKYRIVIYGKSVPIEDLSTDMHPTGATQTERQWGKAVYHGAPWVERQQRPYSVALGMPQRHIAVWASHGRFYKNEKQTWKWQRPYLYCTTEDLFTQTIVIPFLIPMLEKAGAYVFTPRERDWQRNEIIVDNDTPQQNGIYIEKNNKYPWEAYGTGFALRKSVYLDGENPFTDGSTRFAHTVNRKNHASEIRWTPEIPSKGRYAVYVSYSTTPTSVPDAHYVVKHQGVSTIFKVNQQMGGNTWVYLGSFEFDPKDASNNYVSLSNFSNYRGMITADAVRIGGGMGNIARGDSLQETISGMPRFLEGARYSAQWAGMPYSIYSSKNGENDYGDDINVRSHMVNYLAGGSTYLPADSGLHVPLEMTVALHSDAGIAPDSTFIGTLGIYTSNHNEGMLASGVSRLTSRNLCDWVLSQIDKDLTHLYGSWHRRQMYDRNYSETREPQIPSVIIEMLSHQNFRDMRLGHDPYFKFHLARAIYKGILKYSAFMHETKYQIQPLPVTRFYTQIDSDQQQIRLSWTPQNDPLEVSAKAKGYVVYMRKGNGGYDNGTYVKENSMSIHAEKNILYSFKVTAVNEGGESFPTGELTAMIAPETKAKVLIIDGFQRTAGPQVVQTDSTRGFDLTLDPGVPYLCSPGYSGQQLIFNPNHPLQDEIGLSGNELEGKIIAGNTFNHSHTHASAIQAAQHYSFASADRTAIEAQLIDMNEYNIIDLILGLQKNDGYSCVNYPTLTPALCDALKEYTRMQGNVLISGAYIARDQRDKESLDFINNVLKIEAYAPVLIDSLTHITGMNLAFGIYNQLNEQHYAVTHADCLLPSQSAYSTLLFSPQNTSAAIAYPGEKYRSIAMGFPFECITKEEIRNQIMAAFLDFLLAR